MEPSSIIKRFDVIEDGQLDFGMVVPDLAVQEFGLKCAEERFHGGVVVAIAGRAHARKDTVILEELTVISAGVLAAAIRMVQKTRCGKTMFQGHLKAAVGNAVPVLRACADFVTRGKYGKGVVESIERLLNDDLARPIGQQRRRA